MVIEDVQAGRLERFDDGRREFVTKSIDLYYQPLRDLSFTAPRVSFACRSIVSVLGGDVTKKKLPGTYLTKPLVNLVEFGTSYRPRRRSWGCFGNVPGDGIVESPPNH